LKEPQILCAVRRVYVARTPEECVRQALLSHLFRFGGYPEHLTRVEMPIDFFFASGTAPKRRLDIVCFQKKEDSLLPLLLIECKAFTPHASTTSQLFGYNFFVKAPFSAIAWQDSIVIYHKNAPLYQGLISQMPSYNDLRGHT